MIKDYRNTIDCTLADGYEKDYVKSQVIVMWKRTNKRPVR
jgi:hypothetical protein